ncbi:hypothetical protein GYMLUDRAFT_552048 [Collybiopsis luxurians FD-317 M1]|uniref:Uncharacterized protein n=1 Tax=Collybiopsis luxurians FD-317 M1 TaxID=944289 RepID=A0A0D0BED8_9AGAR|nr:hypothetical protein GYMLUDRAFT_552048 [Collybiopsis luxurians FD-317 M1]
MLEKRTVLKMGEIWVYPLVIFAATVSWSTWGPGQIRRCGCRVCWMLSRRVEATSARLLFAFEVVVVEGGDGEPPGRRKAPSIAAFAKDGTRAEWGEDGDCWRSHTIADVLRGYVRRTLICSVLRPMMIMTTTTTIPLYYCCCIESSPSTFFSCHDPPYTK